MKRYLSILSALVLVLTAIPAAAQTRTVTGRVTAAETNAPLPNVQVVAKGTTVGVLTNASGSYSITVPSGATTLVFSAPNYTSREAAISGDQVNVSLTGSAVALEGLVVTALGVERQKSQLGTAQQSVSSEELNQTRAQSVINQIQGKISGVQITGSGTQGGSQKITIRGANSITGSNNPLFIIDGMPISNTGRGSGPGGGYDYGSAINDLNPDDIESMTVLKGPNAAAIYGSKATNGVIVITTKKAKAGQMRTEASMTYTFETPSILPEYQNQYGQGNYGEFNFVNGAGKGVNDGEDASWGPKLDVGNMACQFDSPRDASGKCIPTPLISHPDNVKSFFETGHTLATNVAVSGGTDRVRARLSLGMDNTDGYIPNNTFKKFSGMLNGSVKVNDRLTTDASLQYVRNSALNRPGVGYNVGILEQFIWFGRQVDVKALKDYKKGGAANGGNANAAYNWNYNYHNNPYWLQYENRQFDVRDRVVGNVSATYQLTDWLKATARTGSDVYSFNINRQYGRGNINYANPAYNGGFYNLDDFSNTNNSDLMLQANRDLTSRLQVSALVGGSQFRNSFRTQTVGTSGISAPGIYNPSNAAITPTSTQSISRRQMNSLYGSAAFTWDGWWTLEATGRNDWSSTLPQENNSYFYPSVSTSIVLTDMIPSLQNNVLSYAKLRGSIARVGSDADPYSLRATYSGISTAFGGLPQFTLADALANSELKPEITTSKEIGAEIELFGGRATVDATLYQKATRDQIFPIDLSPTTGFTSRYINAGLMENKGFELGLNLVPVKLDNGFTWQTGFNYAQNHNKLVELIEGVKSINLGNSWYTFIQARAGESYGAIYGNKFLRDEATGKPITTNGYWTLDPTPQVIGNIQPKWTGGWSNSFAYKNLTLNTLLDIRVGGDIVSISNFFGDYAGITKASLKGRENDWDDGIIIDGIDKKTGQPNTVKIDAQDYWQTIFPVMEPYVFDGGWVKLREVRLGFDVPRSWAGKLAASNMNIALTGRNLWAKTHVPNIDPEFSYTIGNFQGIEFAALPNTRTIGLSVNVTP